MVEEINPAHEAGVGFKIDEIRGKRIEEILPPAAAEKVVEAYRRAATKSLLRGCAELVQLPPRSRRVQQLSCL